MTVHEGLTIVESLTLVGYFTIGVLGVILGLALTAKKGD